MPCWFGGSLRSDLNLHLCGYSDLDIWAQGSLSTSLCWHCIDTLLSLRITEEWTYLVRPKSSHWSADPLRAISASRLSKLAIPWLREQVTQPGMLCSWWPCSQGFLGRASVLVLASNCAQALLGEMLFERGQGYAMEHPHKTNERSYASAWAWPWSVLVGWCRSSWWFFHIKDVVLSSYAVCGQVISRDRVILTVLVLVSPQNGLWSGCSLITLQRSLPSAILRNRGLYCKSWSDISFRDDCTPTSLLEPWGNQLLVESVLTKK